MIRLTVIVVIVIFESRDAAERIDLHIGQFVDF